VADPEIEVQVSDVEYQRQGDRAFLARVYQPRGSGPFPTLIDIHGGAWHIGDRLNNAAIDRGLAARGILVVAIDFRQSQDAPYPASLLDVNLGVRWLKAHAAEFNGTAAVGGLGSSSGGHQVLLTALRPRDPRLTGLQLAGPADLDASLAYVVACWPVSNPLERYLRAKEQGLDGVAAYEAYWPSTEAMAEGNPQLIVERGEAMAMPPLFVAQGTADELVPPEMQQRFVEAYRAAGGAVEIRLYEGMPHTFVVRMPTHPQAIQALDDMAQFVHRRAQGSPQPRHQAVAD
jgi:acetyl esterase/lipase